MGMIHDGSYEDGRKFVLYEERIGDRWALVDLIRQVKLDKRMKNPVEFIKWLVNY
jgi:hypothetical protein